jgi:hypothetical protein
MGALVAVLLLAADAPTPAPAEAVQAPAPAPTAPGSTKGAKQAAVLGLVTFALATGMAAATPAYAGTKSDAPLAFGITAFVLVAVVRPFAFFGGQSAKPPKNGVQDALRVTGTASALLGLGTFIAGLVLRANNSSSTVWAMAATAASEAISVGSFSTDALISALR